MSSTGVSDEVLAEKFASVFPHLNERQRRLIAGAEARALGHGGIAQVARASGLHPDTVSQGVAELAGGAPVTDRVRRPRRRAQAVDRDRPGSAAGVEGVDRARRPR